MGCDMALIPGTSRRAEDWQRGMPRLSGIRAFRERACGGEKKPSQEDEPGGVVCIEPGNRQLDRQSREHADERQTCSDDEQTDMRCTQVHGGCLLLVAALWSGIGNYALNGS